jgi:hypothetical protein
MTSPKHRQQDTAAPQRNFTVTTEERVRAVVGGPPAFIRRLRAIEDLEEAIVRILLERREGAPLPEAALERLNDLVARHNRWYPIEANLAIHPRSGALIDRTGQPWEPMAPRTMESMLARARSAG